MSMTSGTPPRIETGASPAPVILPMGLAKDSAGKASPDCHPRIRQQTTLESFAFPAALPRGEEKSSRRADKSVCSLSACPGATWPKCDSTAALQAGATLAEAISRRMSAGHPSVLAITSPGEGDGKTQLTTVLAPEFAKRMPQGVLAVDADFRKADLTSLLALAASRTPGGSPLIYSTDLPGLSVLPRPPGFEWRYLDAAWVESTRETWSLTLLDLASLEHAETVSLLPHCDGVCVVVRLGHTSRRAVSEAGHVISASGCRLWGTVVVG
jgi:Mrp family chromosome partitioning ATPase